LQARLARALGSALSTCSISVALSAPVFAEEPPPQGFEVGAAPSAQPVFQGADAPTPAPPARRSFQLDVGVATEFPISMGAYTSAVNGILTGVGAYDATVGNFIQNAITNSFVLRLSAGWRPFTDHGLEILGGYTLMTLGGSATEGDIINAVLTEAGSSQRVTAGSGATIPLSATMHNVHVTLGWRWLLASDHLVIRASVSYLQCLAANMGVTLPSSAQSMQTAVNQELNNVVAPYFTSYVKTPLVGLSAGYRF
jgi:hypothetical protein